MQNQREPLNIKQNIRKYIHLTISLEMRHGRQIKRSLGLSVEEYSAAVSVRISYKKVFHV